MWNIVNKDKWSTPDNELWDGQTVVWLKNSYTGEDIPIPVFNYPDYVIAKECVFPSYAILYNIPLSPNLPWLMDFEEADKYIGYFRFSSLSSFGVCRTVDSVDRQTLVSMKYGDNLVDTISVSNSDMSESLWETTANFFLFAVKGTTSAIDGYSVYFSGVVSVNSDICSTKIYSPYSIRIPFGTPSLFPNGSEGLSISEQPPNNDPFEPGGGSGTGGGDGDFDNTSTPIEIPGLPTVSAASTGFISLFNPTLSQLNDLASYMWSDIFDIDTLKKLFADPMDVILGLSILPVQIPTSGAREVKVGNIGTGISLNVASTQFVEVDCGTINVNEYWGAYLDYSPYTHAQIYLPYVGVRPISVDEIMGKSVNVNYHVDILTGACCCFVKCGDSVLYSFNGQCSIPIPISATNYTNTINGIINVAASLGTMVATGGATAPLAAATLASTITNHMKPTVEKSGAISGPGGVMGIQTPYLILTRPRQALPSKQNEFTGYPSFITVTLGELSGYTEVHSIHLENIPATADELSEIETLLKGGVIF